MIAVAIPAYNAQRRIAEIVVESRKQLEPVVVVDDGSKDGTGAVAQAVGATLLRHAKNRGKGAALKTAFAWALDNGYEAVITLDADGQHLPGEIPKFLEQYARGREDLIIGGRAHLFHEMLPRRRNANRFSAWCISKCAGVEVTDSQSGFRLYSARLLRALKLHTDGFDLESEVIVLAGKRGFRILTIPIDLGFVDGIGTSHFKPLKDTLRIAWTVTRARLLW
jgi:glycosyltransferase involved in cell wall biosynthesis